MTPIDRETARRNFEAFIAERRWQVEEQNSPRSMGFFGPKRLPDEPASRFRWRHARYSLGWFFALCATEALLTPVMAVAVHFGWRPLQMLTAWLMLFPGFGIVLAAIAAIAMFIAASWAKITETDRHVDRLWRRTKVVTAACLAFGAWLGCIYLVRRALTVYVVPNLDGKPVAFDDDPLSFIAMVGLFVFVIVTYPVLFGRTLRQRWRAIRGQGRQ